MVTETYNYTVYTSQTKTYTLILANNNYQYYNDRNNYTIGTYLR